VASRASFAPTHAGAVHPRIPIVMKRPKRHRIRGTIISTLTFAMIVGGIGAAVYYGKRTLDARAAPPWDDATAALAEKVGEAHGLPTPDPVQVTELDAPTYTTSFSKSMLDITDDNLAQTGAELRAVGLLQGNLDLAGVGATAATARPAFYDRQTNEIFVLQGLPPTVRSRALAVALTELLAWQQGEATTADPAALLGMQLVIDGDARVTGEAVVPTVEQWDMPPAIAGIAAVAPMSPYLVDRLSGDVGTSAAARRAPDAAARGVLISQRPTSDAVVVDASRPETAAPTLRDSAGNTSRGLVYWYYALAGRIPSEEAWSAALAWDGDAITTSSMNGVACISATIVTRDQAGRDLLFAALERWAAAGPIEASSAVSLQGDRIAVSACDPGPTLVTISSVEVNRFGSAPQELEIVATTGAVGDEQRGCVVQAVRGFGLAAMVRAGQQADVDPVVAAIGDACATTGP
jgi:hypothetical protein